jgi:hypothetical protein
MESYFLSSASTATTAQLARIITETLDLAPDKLRSLPLDALINQLVPLKQLSGLSQTLTAKVLEAVVLSSTPLAKPAGQTQQQYRVVLNGVDKQQYEITSKSLLDAGTRIQLKLNNNDTAVLLKILERPTTTKTGQPQSTVPASTLTGNTKPAIPNQSAVTSPRLPMEILAEGVRQNLPQQQPLKSLLPLLQQLTSLPEGTLSKPLNDRVQTLLKHLATPEQLQQPQTLKQTLRNSGVFLESKLAYAAQSKNTEALLKSPALQNDIKTQMQQLSQQINQTQQKSTISAQPAASNTTATTQTSLQSQTSKENITLTATSKPTTVSSAAASSITSSAPLPKTDFQTTQTPASDLEKNIPGFNPATASTPGQNTGPQVQTANREAGLDVILQQLGKQLLASLARTQLNQLESLAYRAANVPDNQGPTNSWVLEIPIVHGQHVDNLELRIDQEELGEQQEDKKQKQWTVMLAFDLHALGKMSVQLKIVSQSVEATVWSQMQKTHHEVQQHIESLQGNLEKIGVKVERVSCFHGLPAKDAPQIHQQLVDLHT